MLGAERRNYDVSSLGMQCMKDLDTSQDGKVTKGFRILFSNKEKQKFATNLIIYTDEFISGLMINYSLRALMSPFN